MTVAHLRPKHASQRAEQELAACTGNPNPHVVQVAIRDATEFAGDVREIDPRQLDGRLELLAHRDLPRLKAMVIVLAAMVPVDLPVTELLAWTESLTAPTAGGAAA